MGREIYQKSKEQLEEEKRAILSQRIPVLQVEGLDSNRLTEKAKELHGLIRKLEGDKYDLEQQFKRQQYDVSSLIGDFNRRSTFVCLFCIEAIRIKR